MNNSKNNGRLTKLNEKIHSSKIFSFLFLIIENLMFYFRKSLFVKIFSSYEYLNDKFRQSILYNIFTGFTKKTNLLFIKKLKFKISKSSEESIAVNFFNSMVNCLIMINVKILSVGFFSYGIYSIIIYFIKIYILSKSNTMSLDLILGIFVIFAGIVFFLFNTSVYNLVYKSYFLNNLLFKLMAFREKSDSVTQKPAFTAYLSAFSIGMFLGILTYFLPSYVLCMGAAVLVIFLLFLYKPEFGALTILTMLPFLPTMVLAVLVIFTAFCYFHKFIRNKRTFDFQITDLFVLLFSFIIFSGGVFSVAPKESLKPALLYLCFILFYFILTNLVKSIDMIYKSIGCIIVSCFLVSLYGIYQNYLGGVVQTWQDSSMFGSISGRVVSTFENPNVLAEYLILILPFVIAALISIQRFKYKFNVFIAFMLTFGCLVFTWSRGSWLGFIISFVFFSILINQKIMSVYLLSLSAIPLLPMILPANITQRFLSIGNIRDSSTSYRLSIWQAVGKMIKDYFLSGIGVGIGPFRIVYPEYSLAGIETAPHSHSLYFQMITEYGIISVIVFAVILFLFCQMCTTTIMKCDSKIQKLFTGAGLFAVLAFCLNGFTDYVWYNYRVYLMFWIIFALTCSICKYVLKNSVNEYTEN